MHINGIDLMNTPWSWVEYWSQTLEKDLTQRRLEASKHAKAPRRR